MTKVLLTIPVLCVVAACSTPEETLKYAQDKCTFIGYDITRERVPTLNCVERQYDRKEDKSNGLVSTGVNALVIAGTEVAIQSALTNNQVQTVEHKFVD